MENRLQSTPHQTKHSKMPRIFISYRRSDSEDITGRIYDRFVTRYGESSVFMDVEAIPPGVDFREHVTEWIASCDVLLVIVGNDWLESSGSDNQRRLEDPLDPVRIELSAALKRDVPVIPVLIGDTLIPSADQLPEEIESFAYRNAVSVRSGRDFQKQIDGVIHDVEMLISDAEPTEAPSLHQSQITASAINSSPLRFSIVSDFFLENFNILYRVLTEGSSFVQSLDHGSKPEFAKAIRYAVFLSLLGVVLMFPALQAGGINFSVPFLIIDTVVSVMCFFLLGVMNHAAVKMLSGNVSLRSSVVVSVYISSILLVSNVIVALTPEIFGAAMTGNLDIINSTPMSPQILLVVGISFLVFFYWLYLQTSTFGRINQFSRGRTIMLGLLFVISFSIFSGFMSIVSVGYTQPFVESTVKTPTHSIAVLPFTFTRGDDETASLASGLTQDVMERLVQNKDLIVASQTSSSQLSSLALTLPEIATKLNVAYVLEGSVRLAGENIRITSQLLRASDGLRVWSNSYLGDGVDSYEIYEDIAQDIAVQTSVEVWLDVRRPDENALFEIDNLAAEYYQKSQEQYELINSGKGGDWLVREKLLQRAVETDRDHYLSQVWLANSYMQRLGGQLSLQIASSAAHTAIDRVLELDPDAAMTLLQLGQIQTNLDLDYASSEPVFKRILDEYPGFGTWANFGLARIALREGRIDESLKFLAAAPGNSGASEQASFLSAYAWFLLLSGDYEKTLKVADEALGFGTEGLKRADILNTRAMAFIMLGRVSEAKRTINESWNLAGRKQPELYPFLFARIGEEERAREILANSDQDFASGKYALAMSYLALEEVDRAFNAIESGIRNHDDLLFDSLRTGVFWNEIREDPRFEEMITLMHSEEIHTDQYLQRP